METEHVDFLVLGGGTAGQVAAKRIARAGRRVSLVDPNPVGGLCALRGCNPKKILVRAAELVDETRHAAEHGIEPNDVRVHWDRTIARKRRFTQPVTESSEQALAEAGVALVQARPSFIAPDRVVAGDQILAFVSALIATGSTPRPLGFPGHEHARTSDDLLELQDPPGRLVIIGAGTVAFEFAHVFARLGTQVDMLVRNGHPLRLADDDLVAELGRYSQHLGIRIHLHARAAEIVATGSEHIVVTEDGQQLPCDYVLNATGRVLAAEGLALEKAGISYRPEGVRVNEYLRAVENPRVFSAGDANGQMPFTPVASYEARVVVENFLLGDHKRADYTAIPWVVFTVPPLAGVGLTEAQAREQGAPLEVVRKEMADWTVFAIRGDGPALGKVLYDRHSGHVLGAHVLGAGADELIHTFAMAMRYGLTRAQLRDMIFAYPTLSSALQYLV